MCTLVRVSSRMIVSPPALLAMVSPLIKNSKQNKRQLRGKRLVLFYGHSVSLLTVRRFLFTGKNFCIAAAKQTCC